MGEDVGVSSQTNFYSSKHCLKRGIAVLNGVVHIGSFLFGTTPGKNIGGTIGVTLSAKVSQACMLGGMFLQDKTKIRTEPERCKPGYPAPSC